MNTPLRTLFFHQDKVTITALAAGREDAELVVLLHGFPEQGLAWTKQLRRLARAGFLAVAPDQRGYGRSSKPEGASAYTLDLLAADVLAMADRLGRERFSVVGHDWGAAVGWELASRYPDRIRSLVAMNGPHSGTVLQNSLRCPTQFLRGWYVGLFQLPAVPEVMLAANEFRWLKQMLAGTCRPGAIPPDLLAVYERSWASPGTLSAMVNWYRALSLSPPTPLQPISVPATIIWGELDAFIERTIADAALSLCAEGELIALPDATHWLHHEEPDQVGRLILRGLGDRNAPEVPQRCHSLKVARC